MNWVPLHEQTPPIGKHLLTYVPAHKYGPLSFTPELYLAVYTDTGKFIFEAAALCHKECRPTHWCLIVLPENKP